MCALSLRDLSIEARQRLAHAVYDFFAGGSDDEITLQANETAFGRIGLLPRILRGSTGCPLDVELPGGCASMPILIAPTAFHRLAHPDGECATARAAAAAGVVMIVSMASTTAVEAIAEAADEVALALAPQLWLQLFIQPDLAFTEALVRRAEAAGCTALVVSVDVPVFGSREQELRTDLLDLPQALCCELMRTANGDVRPIELSAELGWRHLDWLRGITSLPIVIKGVVHPADAELAVTRGIDAIIVSNHGGRQLDTMPAAIELLPAITGAVGGRVPVLMDGGVRRGTDVVKALALGARAIGIGRPVLWGLAVDGEQGVAHVLALLRSELERALTLCGCGCRRASVVSRGSSLRHVRHGERPNCQPITWTRSSTLVHRLAAVSTMSASSTTPTASTRASGRRSDLCLERSSAAATATSSSIVLVGPNRWRII
jgi:4-hydroxymandelate oxidase